MAGYVVRSLAQLTAEAKGAFVQAVQGTAAKLLPNVWRVESKVLALLGFEQEQRRAFLYDQIFASRASRLWLLRHGFELGLTINPAKAAYGAIVVPATAGVPVPAGLGFARGDGVTYTTLASETPTGTTVTLLVEADDPGAAGNCDPGTALALVGLDSAPAGLGATGIVDTVGFAGGADDEPLESFRARVLARKRQPPQGGSGPDYETWTREALSSVDRVFVDSFANDTRSVWVAFTVTDQPGGIPTAGQVAIVQAYIDDPVRRPVTARAFAIQLTLLPIPILVQGLTPDSLDIRASLEAELAAEFVDRGEPGKPTAPALFSKTWLDEAASRAVGEDRHKLLRPVDDISAPAGFLPALGPVTYTD